MAKKLKILSVDDDFINLKLINVMLKKNPNVAEVLEAKNGAEALDVLKARPDIDMVLLDIKMPIMDGIQFLVTIHSHSMQELKNIPIVVLTTDDTRKYEALEKGAHDFLIKPIREHDLFEKIQKITQLFG
ncbi:MAG: response regulator [Campylobacteraceae bacterium]|jgi:putative two-component system response regulator|nr:response regulator [Campylobacteraceae bacterium]